MATVVTVAPVVRAASVAVTRSLASASSSLQVPAVLRAVPSSAPPLPRRKKEELNNVTA
jgi:hypothetical protein